MTTVRGDRRASLTVPAPAKLNAFLHVTGRRDDGYHTLESLMVALDFGDTITLTRRDDGAIERTADVPGVPVESDLSLRAARALQQATSSRFGVDIAIEKRIPPGGGLGGGSSDAASVLLALNRLWGVGLAREDLMAIGVRLGADVPFFIFGSPALARGIGERLTEVTLAPRWAAVIVPPCAVATATIFAAPELTRAGASLKIEIFSEGYGRNDLQAVAVARYPDIAAALEALSRASDAARMTGSGACVYAWFESEAAARAALATTGPAARGFVARTLARHPLAAFA
jgi:4-diphosphocytidyl-2-C-methyl-D-erythritol kinase